MAFLAGKALSDMGLVGETHVSGKVVYPHPGHRLTFIPIGLEVLDLRLLGRGDLVAAHAKPDRGDPGDRGPLRVRVTKLARDLVVPAMDFVAERDRLSRDFGGMDEDIEKNEESSKDDAGKDSVVNLSTA